MELFGGAGRWCQLLTCTTPYMVNPQNGFISLRMAVSPTVTIPGLHLIHARLHNNIQQPGLAQCIGDPASTGCGRLTVTTRAPRVPAMEVVSTAHDPDTVYLGQQIGLQVEFRNSGDGNADATRLIVALPPGIAFSHAAGAIPALTCTATGLVADGQRVTCEGFGLPSAVFGQVRLLMDVGYVIDAPALLTVVIGLDHAATPTTGLIEACVSDPPPTWCAWHELSVAWRCADRYGADGVYGDGFQMPPSP